MPKEKYQPSQDEVQKADEMMTDYEKSESQRREKFLGQTPEEAHLRLEQILEGSYDDKAGGIMLKAFKSELKLVQKAIPELESLGYEIKVESTGFGGMGGTHIYLKLGGHVFELLSQFYDTYRESLHSNLKGHADGLFESLIGKIEMAKSFGKIYQKEKESK